MRLEFLDFEEIFDPRRVITNPEAVDKKTKKFTPDGIFSEEIFGKLDSEGIQYSCECGKYMGRFYLNKKCERCNTYVKFTEPIINRIGWIDFGEYYIINPIFYALLSKITSKSKLNKIISFERKLTRDGELLDETDEEEPYYQIGLIKFREKLFDDILEYLASMSKVTNLDKYLEIIQNNRDKVFINKFPVYSTTLRPALMMDSSLIFDEVNNLYNSLIMNVNTLKESTEAEKKDIFVLPILFNMQMTANQIFEKCLDNIKGKTGFIRNNMMGSRVNFSARCVITPLPAGYAIDDIVLPYLTFMELYKFQILNVLSSVKGVSFVEANHIWNEATTHFDEEMYRIMEEIRVKSNAKILLNRNPTINIGSIMCLNIAGIKRDYDDVTASIHNSILAPMGGDYDGDTLNIIPLMDEDFKKYFSKYSPKRMLLDNNDGNFNSALSIARDQILGVYSFNN